MFVHLADVIAEIREQQEERYIAQERTNQGLMAAFDDQRRRVSVIEEAMIAIAQEAEAQRARAG